MQQILNHLNNIIMKRNFFIALMCVLSAGLFFACKGNGVTGGTDPEGIDPSTLDNTVKKCWEITYTVGSATEVGYLWATEQECVATIQTESKMVGGTGKWTYKQNAAKDEASCDAQNPEKEDAECWQITVSNGYQNMVWYIWDSEEGAQAAIKVYENKNTGWRGTYKKADADDEDACEKLEENPQNPDQPTDPTDYSQYDDKVQKCWEVTSTIYGMSITEYVWMTERMLVQSMDVTGVAYSYKLADASDEHACALLNHEDDPTDPDDPDPVQPQEKACWLITTTVGEQTISVYHWMTEEEAKVAAEASKGTYEKAEADDEDACHQLNADNPMLQGEKSCWEITINLDAIGQSTSFFLWGTEDMVKLAITAAEEEYKDYESLGLRVSYKPAEADDEDACNSLNTIK